MQAWLWCLSSTNHIQEPTGHSPLACLYKCSMESIMPGGIMESRVLMFDFNFINDGALDHCHLQACLDSWNGCHGNQWYLWEQIFCSAVLHI